MELRDYQNEAVWKTVESFAEGHRKVLMVMATGGGKTITFAHMAKLIGGKTLILAHRDELIQQAVDKLYRACGIVGRIEKAQHKAPLGSACVVSSIQTMSRRLKKWPPNYFDFIVIDEAHRSLAKSYIKIIDHFEKAKLLGVTATPDRNDRRSLGEVYETTSVDIGIVKLIKDGWLSPVRIRTIPLEIDLGKAKKSKGDIDVTEMGHALEPFINKLAREILDNAGKRRTLIFLPLRETSRKMVEALKALGATAVHVDGESKDRSEIRRAFEANEVQFVCNAMLWTEGFDDPGIECVVPLRATTSRSLYCQMVGRGTRLFPGKKDLLVLDFLWHHERHSLCAPACLVGAGRSDLEEETEVIMGKSFKGDEELDLIEVLSESESKAESSLKRKLEEENRKRRLRENKGGGEVDLLDLKELGVTFKPAPFAPPPSEKQVSLLRKFKIDPSKVHTRDQATKLIGRFLARRKTGLASPVQMRWLKRFGHESPETATASEAKEFLTTKFSK